MSEKFSKTILLVRADIWTAYRIPLPYTQSIVTAKCNAGLSGNSEILGELCHSTYATAQVCATT